MKRLHDDDDDKSNVKAGGRANAGCKQGAGVRMGGSQREGCEFAYGSGARPGHRISTSRCGMCCPWSLRGHAVRCGATAARGRMRAKGTRGQRTGAITHP